NPIEVLKGKLAHTKQGITFRKALVIGQFAITVALIIGSIVVVNQLKFINEKELGFNMDQVLVINPPVLTGWDSTYIGRMNNFKEELKKISQVKNAATSWSVPGGDIGRSFDVSIAESVDHNKFTMRHTGVDYNFMDVYGIKFIAGRNFTPSDHNPDFNKLNSIIINKLAVKTFGYTEPAEILGKTLIRGKKKWTVVGVVDNYHQKSLRYALEPMIFMPAYSTFSEISVKLNPGDVTNTIAMIKSTFESFFPGNIFDYVFQDEQFNRQYQNDKLFGRVFSIFAGFAIFVACIGLMGLAMFSTIQRTKEIGIRKVLGASVSGLFVLVSRDFIKLVIIASVIAFPLAWYVMNKWLNDFAFRIDISPWIFVVAGLAAIGIAVVTVGYQAIKAALVNPVISLRSE
ncbi:MAG: ABC transporter permease, partial [Saprospiraceae bacterium]